MISNELIVITMAFVTGVAIVSIAHVARSLTTEINLMLLLALFTTIVVLTTLANATPIGLGFFPVVFFVVLLSYTTPVILERLRK